MPEQTAQLAKLPCPQLALGQMGLGVPEAGGQSAVLDWATSGVGGKGSADAMLNGSMLRTFAPIDFRISCVE